MHQQPFAEGLQAYEDMFNEDTFVDHWWPMNGLDWLNSLPVDVNML